MPGDLDARCVIGPWTATPANLTGGQSRPQSLNCLNGRRCVPPLLWFDAWLVPGPGQPIADDGYSAARQLRVFHFNAAVTMIDIP